MKIARWVVLGAIAAIVGMVFFGETEPEPEQVGYFKSSDRNRVMAYVAVEGMTKAKAEAFLQNRMHTEGKLTYAVIYRSGSPNPGDRLTNAGSTGAALELVNSAPYDGWLWGVGHYPTGKVAFLKEGEKIKEW